MKKRTDNKNRVLKDGEIWREKECRYMFRWQDENGKRHCTYAQTLSELREKEKDIRRDMEDGIRTEGKSITVDEEFLLWQKTKEGLKSTTATNYAYMYKQFISPALGCKKLVDIRKSDIRAFYNSLVRQDDHTRVMAINTLDIINNILHQIFQVAYDDDVIRKNPVDGVLVAVKKANHYETPKRHALTIQQQEAFVNFIASEPKYQCWIAIFAAFLGTGCRVSEMVGLRWCDIDFEDNTISVNHNLVYYNHLQGGCYCNVTTPKTKAGIRVIPMLPDVKRALIDEKKRQQELGMKCKTVVDGYTDFVFLNRFCEVHHPSAVNRAINRISIAYNAKELDLAESEGREPVLLPKFSCHTFRHTFCTRLCENEPNIKVIQDIMGHADINTTMEIYAEVQKELKESAARNLAGKFCVYGA